MKNLIKKTLNFFRKKPGDNSAPQTETQTGNEPMPDEASTQAAENFRKNAIHRKLKQVGYRTEQIQVLNRKKNTKGDTAEDK